MNKGIVVGIGIAILVILGGVYLMSSDTQSTNIPIEESGNLVDSEPKRYSASLSESVTISTP